MADRETKQLQAPSRRSFRSRLLWFSLAATAFAPVAPAQATFPGTDGRIAFQNRVNGNLDIYTVEPDGSDVQRLTAHPASDFTPRWSPDGRRIVFVSRRDGVDDLYVMREDGSALTRLATAATRDRGPTWSADGRRIFFHSGPDLYAIDADGTGEVKLTDDSDLDLGITAAPHGSKLAFSRLFGDYLQLFSMRSDGTGLEQITDVQAHNDQANWSPKGNDLVFVRDDSGVDNDIYVIHKNGQQERRLTDTPTLIEFVPVWSPEGDRLAFERCANFFTSPDCGIFLMPAAGGTPSQLQVEGQARGPDWQPAPRQSP